MVLSALATDELGQFPTGPGKYAKVGIMSLLTSIWKTMRDEGIISKVKKNTKQKAACCSDWNVGRGTSGRRDVGCKRARGCSLEISKMALYKRYLNLDVHP